MAKGIRAALYRTHLTHLVAIRVSMKQLHATIVHARLHFENKWLTANAKLDDLSHRKVLCE
jgi:hypothetical protein